MSIVKPSSDGKMFVEYGKHIKYYPRNKPELKDFHQKIDRPIAVIGSGPSVMDDFKKVPKDAICFAVNFHFLEKGIFDFEYLAFLDDPHRGINAESKVKYYSRFDGLRFSNKMDWTDVYCVDEEPLIIGDSGLFTIWIALYMTTDKVYVCGMNNRNPGEPIYSELSHVADQGINPDKTRPVKYGRWAMLYESAEAPQRMVLFNNKIKDFLKDRGYDTHEV
jgi:hypothetical protein